ncbi:MAG TPA: DUF6687 family protein [Pirellulales bacterium]|jgi:hypothetical protein
MIENFLILDHDTPPPAVEHIIYCDGSGGRAFREDKDLDLSHWRPNRTLARYRADTSTEICFRFLDDPVQVRWTLAVNNHLDVDGMLAVYALVHSGDALSHRSTIVQAAEMGDFWAWGEPPAQRLFQGLTRLMNRGTSESRSVQSIYEEAFRRIPAIIAQADPDSAEIERSLDPLRDGVRLVEEHAIRRMELGTRFAHYVIPGTVVGQELDRAIYIPKFNEQISRKALLWPQARAKWDGERVCLVSVEAARGWHHDVWFPGYLWAEISDRWAIPGMNYRDGMESYDLDMPAFNHAIQQLNDAEQGARNWTTCAGAFMFNSLIQSQYPVVARVLDKDGTAVASRLDPAVVAKTLLPAFTFE